MAVRPTQIMWDPVNDFYYRGREDATTKIALGAGAGYFILAGVAGGQTGYGGTLASNNLTLGSTAHATKGKIYFGSSSAYDELNVRLGIGTVSPGYKLDVYGNGKFGTSGVDGSLDLVFWRADNFSSGLHCYKRGQTGDINGLVLSGAELGYHTFYGWDGSTYGRGAFVLANATEDWDGSGHGSKYSIYVTPNNTITNQIALLIENTREVQTYNHLHLSLGSNLYFYNATNTEYSILGRDDNYLWINSGAGGNIMIQSNGTNVMYLGTSGVLIYSDADIRNGKRIYFHNVGDGEYGQIYRGDDWLYINAGTGGNVNLSSEFLQPGYNYIPNGGPDVQYGWGYGTAGGATGGYSSTYVTAFAPLSVYETCNKIAGWTSNYVKTPNFSTMPWFEKGKPYCISCYVRTTVTAGFVAFITGSYGMSISSGTITVDAAISTPTGLALTQLSGGGSLPADTYRLVVTALNGNGETLATAYQQVTVSLNDRIQIDWTAVTGASSYYVYGMNSTGDAVAYGNPQYYGQYVGNSATNQLILSAWSPVSSMLPPAVSTAEWKRLTGYNLAPTGYAPTGSGVAIYVYPPDAYNGTFYVTAAKMESGTSSTPYTKGVQDSLVPITDGQYYLGTSIRRYLEANIGGNGIYLNNPGLTETARIWRADDALYMNSGTGGNFVLQVDGTEILGMTTTYAVFKKFVWTEGNRYQIQTGSDLYAGMVQEVNGQIIDFGTNYSQLYGRVTSSRGSFFRIDTRDAYDLFQIILQDPSPATEDVIFSVHRTGLVSIRNGADVRWYNASEGEYARTYRTDDYLIIDAGTGGELLFRYAGTNVAYMGSSGLFSYSHLTLRSGNTFYICNSDNTANASMYKTDDYLLFDIPTGDGYRFLINGTAEVLFNSGGDIELFNSNKVYWWNADESESAYIQKDDNKLLIFNGFDAIHYDAENIHQFKVDSTDTLWLGLHFEEMHGFTTSTSTGDFTTIATLTDLAVNNTVMRIKANIVGGSSSNGAGYFMQGTFKNVSGTVTQVGATKKEAEEDSASYDVQFLISGTSVLIQVKGINAENANWECYYDIIKTPLGS